MLIRILGLKNDSCISFSSLEFLHFDCLRGDGGATTSAIFICISETLSIIFSNGQPGLLGIGCIFMI